MDQGPGSAAAVTEALLRGTAGDARPEARLHTAGPQSWLSLGSGESRAEGRSENTDLASVCLCCTPTAFSSQSCRPWSSIQGLAWLWRVLPSRDALQGADVGGLPGRAASQLFPRAVVFPLLGTSHGHTQV